MSDLRKPGSEKRIEGKKRDSIKKRLRDGVYDLRHETVLRPEMVGTTTT